MKNPVEDVQESAVEAIDLAMFAIKLSGDYPGDTSMNEAFKVLASQLNLAKYF